MSKLNAAKDLLNKDLLNAPAKVLSTAPFTKLEHAVTSAPFFLPPSPKKVHLVVRLERCGQERPQFRSKPSSRQLSSCTHSFTFKAMSDVREPCPCPLKWQLRMAKWKPALLATRTFSCSALVGCLNPQIVQEQTCAGPFFSASPHEPRQKHSTPLVPFWSLATPTKPDPPPTTRRSLQNQPCLHHGPPFPLFSPRCFPVPPRCFPSPSSTARRRSPMRTVLS